MHEMFCQVWNFNSQKLYYRCKQWEELYYISLFFIYFISKMSKKLFIFTFIYVALCVNTFERHCKNGLWVPTLFVAHLLQSPETRFLSGKPLYHHYHLWISYFTTSVVAWHFLGLMLLINFSAVTDVVFKTVVKPFSTSEKIKTFPARKLFCLSVNSPKPSE